MVQDIKITPSGAGDKIPQMLFTGSGATATNMELNVQGDSRLSYEGNEGEVFSISKNLQSGVIFAVKDISGLDQISINASGDTYLSPYYGNVRVGATGVMHPDYALDVQGKGLRIGGSGTVLTRASAPAVTTDTLYNVAGSLYFDGSTVGGGSAAGAIHQIQYNDGSNFAGDSQFLFSKANAAFTNDRVLVVSGTIIANSGDANYPNPVSIGSGAYVTCNNAVVIGKAARSVGSYYAGAIAVGSNSQAVGGSVAIGYSASSNTHNNSVAIGGGALANSEKCVAIGHSAQAANGGVSIGNGAGGGGGGPYGHAICIGEASSSASNTITMGGDSSTAEQFGMAIGYNSHSRGYRGVALSPYASAGQHSVALGNGAIAPDGGFVLASGSALTDVLLSGVMKTHLTMPNGQQFIQMATAAQTTDLMQWQDSAGTNVASMTPSGVLNLCSITHSGVQVLLGKGATSDDGWTTPPTLHDYPVVAIGGNALAGAYSVAIGENADAGQTRIEKSSVAIGQNADAHEKFVVAVGRYSQGENQSVAIGAGAFARENSVSIGYLSTSEATGDQSTQVGGGSKGANYSVAFGDNAHATADRSAAFGSYTDALGERSIAIGYKAQAHGTSWVIASGDTSAEVGISGVFGSYVAIPNDQKLAVGGNVPTYTVDALGHGAMVRATGVIVGNSGVVLASNTPSVTTNTLYNAGGTLSFNGSAVGGGGAAPASGSIYEVQYNGDGTNLGADSDFTWNPSTNVMTVTGHISASTKSFLIDHPTKPDKKLQYACLEGPENGVYVRGHTNDNLIDLPDYWTALVDPESITVQLTAKDAPQPFLYVSGVLNNQVHLISDREISAYYVVNATRKDVEPLLVEPNNYRGE